HRLVQNVVGLRRVLSSSALPILPQSVSRGARLSGLPGSRLLRPVRLLAPLYGSDWAFNGPVVLPVAGCDYNSDWTPLLAGLSPAGMAASLAALIRPCSGLDSKKSWQGGDNDEERAKSHRLITESPCSQGCAGKPQ